MTEQRKQQESRLIVKKDLSFSTTLKALEQKRHMFVYMHPCSKTSRRAMTDLLCLLDSRGLLAFLLRCGAQI